MSPRGGGGGLWLCVRAKGANLQLTQKILHLGFPVAKLSAGVVESAFAN